MIDTHCHLTDPRLRSQLEAVLMRASLAGVDRIISVGTDIEDDRAAIALCKGRPNVRCAVGVHPNYAVGVEVSDLVQLRAMLDENVVALGEMGLDYFHQDVPPVRQATLFTAQLELARELGKPVIIHCRQAIEDALTILRDFPAVPAVFHCFTGTLREARRVIEAGHMLSFTGTITFKNAGDQRDVAAWAPLDRVMVETDAPYLSPAPMRKQKVNEPSLTPHTAAVLAAVKNVSVAEIDGQTTANAERFFGWARA